MIPLRALEQTSVQPRSEQRSRFVVKRFTQLIRVEPGAIEEDIARQCEDFEADMPDFFHTE